MADKITAPDVIEAKQLVKDIGDVEKAFASLLSQMKLVTAESGNFRTQSQGNRTIQTRIKLEDEASAKIKERVRLQNQLLRQEARNNELTSDTAKALTEQRVQTQLLNREGRRAALLVSETAGAYKRLSTELAISKDNLKNIIVEQGKFSQAAIKQGREVERLAKRVKEADNAAGDFQRNVGNYPTALKPALGIIRDLVAGFGVIEGLRIAGRFAQESIELAREARGIEFAFNRLGEAGVDAFTDIKESTRGALSDLDIKAAINDFDNFNLTVGDLSTILEFVSVRASQTGKSFDQLKDSAIEAITKESVLRADNLGLSQQELNEKIDAGATFMEAFGEIARREIGEAGTLLDDAANSTQRFDVAAENLSLTFGKIFDQFTNSDVIVGFFEGLNDLLKTSEELTTEFNNSLKNTAAEAFLQDLEIQAISTGKTLKDVAQNEFFRYRTGIDESKESIRQLKEQLEELDNRSIGGGFGTTMQTLRDETNKVVSEQERLNTLLEEEERSLAIKEGRLKTINGLIRNNTEETKENTEEQEKANGVREKVFTAGTIDFYKNEISKLEDLRDSTALTTEEYQKFSDTIEDLKFKIRDLQENLKNPEDVVKVPELAILGDTNIYGDLFSTGTTELEKFQNARIQAEENYTKFLADQKDKQAELVRGVFQEFQNLYGIDAQAFANLFDSKKNDIADFANAAIELNNLLFNIAEENRQQDLENARAVLDKTLEDTTKSDEQKAAAQEKFRKEEAKIKKKSFEADKKAAILNVQIATAVGIAKLWASPGFPAAIPLTVLLAALGIAQTAVIASKKPPKFFKGTRNAPEGLAWTDEQGAEIHTDKHGNVKDFGSNKGPRLKWLESGDKIFTAPETKAILSQGHQERVAYKQMQSDSRLYEEVKGLRREMARYANRVPQLNVNAKVEQPITGY